MKNFCLLNCRQINSLSYLFGTTHHNVCGTCSASQQEITERQRCHLLEVGAQVWGALPLVIQISFYYPLSVVFISSAAKLFCTQELFIKWIVFAWSQIQRALGLLCSYTPLTKCGDFVKGIMILGAHHQKTWCAYQNARIIAYII